MQVFLQPPGGNSVPVSVAGPQATVASLVSAYCSDQGLAFDSNLAIIDSKGRSLPTFSTLASLGISDGQHLLIAYEDNSSLQKNWPLIAAGIALVIGVVGIITISLVYGLSGGKFPFDHGVVMDAGSSKTNTIVYKWQGNKHKGTGCVSQIENCFAKGGVAEMDPWDLSLIVNCTKKVTSHIDPNIRPTTPLYFAATAGLRLLNLTDPNKVDTILNNLNNQLHITGLSVKAIEIISGRDEGLYDWITANFLEQTLELPQKTNPWEPTTYGALDMGGASMQIAYSLPEEEGRGNPDVWGIQLYGQTHNVLAMSNLCFGRDEAERRYHLLLLKDMKQTTIVDPCLPMGFEYNMSGADLLDRPCTHTRKFDLSKDPDFRRRTYSFIGSSQPDFCQKNVSLLISDSVCKDYNFKECFRKLDNIPGDQKYLAFASYFYTTNFLNITEGTLREFEDVVVKFCSKDMNEVKKISDSSYALKYCFNAQYIHRVLLDGFGFNHSTWNNIKFVGEIAGKDVVWSLGYMINATNALPTRAPFPRSISAGALTVSLIIFIVVVILTVVFVYHRQSKKGRRETQSYGKA